MIFEASSVLGDCEMYLRMHVSYRHLWGGGIEFLYSEFVRRNRMDS